MSCLLWMSALATLLLELAAHDRRRAANALPRGSCLSGSNFYLSDRPDVCFGATRRRLHGVADVVLAA